MTAHLIAKEGPRKGLVLNLAEQDEWIVGRDPSVASFVIEDDTVSRKHAHFFNASEGVYLENLSRVNPTLVNHETIHGRVLLKPGDAIQIGQTVFTFSEGDLPELPLAEHREEQEREPFEPEENAHDTIFEDAEEAAPLPLETPFILKVISGPNAGAEIQLEQGRSYTLGKDPDSCDVVFQDLSVSRTHARLTLSPEGEIDLEDLGSKNGTLVNGITLTENRRIHPHDMVALGTTVFLIIDRQAPQETIYSAPIASPESAEVEAIREEEPVEPPAEEKTPEAAGDWKKERIPMKYLLGAGSLLAIFLIAFLSFFSLFKSERVETVRKEPVHRITEALALFPGVQFSFNPASGKLFIVGHVLTAVEAQEMRFRIDEIEFILSVEDNVVIDEGVDEMMNDILSATPLFRSVAVRSAHPGKFSISGYLETMDAMQQLNDYLLVNFPYPDRLENQCIVGEALRAQIQSMLQSEGFSALSFQYTNGGIVLSGNYSEKKESEFQELIRKIKAIQGINSIKNYALSVAPNKAAIDISQEFRVSGSAFRDGSGYNVIINERIYAVGDTMNEMTITEIDPTMILLEKDGIKYRINYTR